MFRKCAEDNDIDINIIEEDAINKMCKEVGIDSFDNTNWNCSKHDEKYVDDLPGEKLDPTLVKRARKEECLPMERT